MRATNYKHYGSESKTSRATAQRTKKRKGAKAITFGLTVVCVAAALIVPTTTLAPDVGAYEDSKIASYSVGDIDEFAGVIINNCVEVTTAPQTQELTTEAKTEETTVAATEKAMEETKAEKATEETSSTEAEASQSQEPSEYDSTDYSYDDSSDFDYSYEYDFSESTDYSDGSYLIGISNPDPNYNPKHVTLSSYDRAKLERLVMGEAGSMGYNGCALVAQAIRDAMNRSNTSSIDEIISTYQYYGSTSMKPTQTVKEAVSYIFDQDGSAVQHRVLCFYTGHSSWHETQTFIVGCGNVRFFDFKY